jgi:hypothetical protein
MLKKLLVDEGLMEAEPVVPTVPEPLDEGFGTPLGKTGVEPFETVKPGVVQNPELWQRHYEQRFSEPGVDEAVATQEAKLKREEKEQKQIQLRARMQKVKDTNTVEEYKAELKRLMHSEDKAIKEVADDLLGDMDPDYIKYIEEKEPISYEDYLRYE